MKIGYPCINRSVGCSTNSTFRLANFSEEIILKKISSNLCCLEKILDYNIKKELLFFRISSDIIPFAGHKDVVFDWQNRFKKEIKEIGKKIKENDIRISMHPDQFVLINSPRKDIVEKSVLELEWQCELLDLMELDSSAKVQIHVGGVYKEKRTSMERFVFNYLKLSDRIKKRMVVENDDHLYSVKDCLYLSEKTGVPVLLDVFHHHCLNNGESISEAVSMVRKTWSEKLMIDYSSQESGARKGKHTESIDIEDFKSFILETKSFDFDIMLEIKDKEKSALKALKVIKKYEKSL